MKKKVTVLLLAFCLVLLAAACGTPSPKDIVKAEFEDAKASPEVILNEVGVDAFGEEATELLVDKMLDFDYELGEETIDGETATVEVSLTTYPFGELLAASLSDIFSSDMEELAGMTEEDLTSYMGEALISQLNAAEKTYSSDFTIELYLADGNWKLQDSLEMSDALTGGMTSLAGDAIDSLS